MHFTVNKIAMEIHYMYSILYVVLCKWKVAEVIGDNST